MNNKLLAHREIDENGTIKKQSLQEHLLNVGQIAGNIGFCVEIESLMTLIGYLHDLGKADRAFQDYINGNTNKKVNHSSAGSKIFLQILNNIKGDIVSSNEIRFQYYKEIVIYLIQSHHGLYDLVDIIEGKNRSSVRLKYEDTGEYHFNEDVLNYFNYFDNYIIDKYGHSFNELALKGFEEFCLTFTRLKQMAKSNSSILSNKSTYLQEFNYYVSCFVRLCLSILKEADIYDSANSFIKEKQKVWKQDELNNVWNDGYTKIEKIYENYEKAKDPSELNYTRNKMARSAKQFATYYNEGIFQLEMPTGAGKTNSSLRYALTNAKKYNKNRIFYITAYLSVLEQNSSEIKKIIQDDSVILEHHSNVVIEGKETNESSEDKLEYSMLTYIRDSWESPIILTTMVQFCNSLFKGKANQLRRFSKLINSVIIIDEVQSLPLKVIYNFNLMMNFMKEIMNCNIVHCTATQPVLDSKALNYPVYYGDKCNNNCSIVEKELINRTCFDRVEYYNLTGENATNKMSTMDIITHVKKAVSNVNSCLIILNTKTAVKTLYDEMTKHLPNITIVYLTTNLCAAHRLELIDEMKDILLENRKENQEKKLICISTQLIEAGVDLDFDCVYRSMAGIDSLVQCAGRCNREGKLTRSGKKVSGKIHIIKYDKENLANLQDIKQTVDASEEAIRNIKNIDENTPVSLDEIKQYYFNKYYMQNENKLYYWVKKDNENMLEELSVNKNKRTEYKQISRNSYPYRLAQSFRTAADNFELIKQDTVGVIVYYKNDELIEQLQEAIYRRKHNEVSKLLRKLQRTTVNVYRDEKLKPYVRDLIDNNVDKQNQILLLDKHYYDNHMGIVTEELANFII